MQPVDKSNLCPECDNGPTTSAGYGRRDFMRVVGTTVAAVAVSGVAQWTPLALARAARAKKQAEAESLVFELYKTMDIDQKKQLVLPWNAGTKGGLPARLATHNAPVGKSVIGEAYSKKQVELLHKIFRSISNGEEGYKQLSRNDNFDNSGSFDSIGALIYGEPVEGKQFSLVFAGHHITLRCDGNSEERTAFGGPLYYGHSPSGYSPNNVFFYQTKALTEMYGALSEKQRQAGVMDGKWKDGVDSVKLPKTDAVLPGVKYADMSQDQQQLVEKVMRVLVAPYRKEDGDEVMEIVKANGGLEKLSLAFYKEGEITPARPWSYWRLEGPGFVWSFRATPHIHTFVNISSKIM